MATGADADERTRLVKDAGAEEIGGESVEVLSALSLCVFFNFAVQTVTTTQQLMSSQLQYTADGPWFFMLVQSLPLIAGSVLSLLSSQYDDSFDKSFGILKTMHFRIVVVGVLTMILAIGIALLQNGYAQVFLGLLCTFCAVAAQLAVFQLVAVLNPKWQAASTSAVVLACVIPIQTVKFVGADISSHWSTAQRVWVFAPPIVLAFLSVAIFAKFWPAELPSETPAFGRGPFAPEPSEGKAGEDPAITADSPRGSVTSAARSTLDRGLTRGLRRLQSRQDETQVSGITASASATPKLKWAPFPFWLVNACSFMNGVMYFVYPLIAFTPNSGGQAELIIARFWGEISGTACGASLVFLGLAAPTHAAVALFVGLALCRVASLFWIMPLLLAGTLPPSTLFWFRTSENLMYTAGTPIVLLAARLADRREVLRSDTYVHFVSGLVGVVVAMAVVGALDHD
jgi:hypothetical protein